MLLDQEVAATERAESPSPSPDDLAQTTSSVFGGSRERLGTAMAKAVSAPLLPAAPSPHMSAWFCSTHAGSDKTVKRPSWRPLGDTWRQWETDPAATGTFSRYSQIRSDVHDASHFVHGCVPHWGKESNIRVKGVLEHELTWAYYRMRRHNDHPHRKEVNDQMETGTAALQFWRDLKPPFRIVDVKALQDPVGHADGKLFNIHYMCGLDYCTERKFGEKSDAGTFSNVISGIAQVRMPDSYPVKRPMRILSWGKPVLNEQPQQEDGFDLEKPGSVNPDVWMPIADELGIRADAPRLAACREATRRAVPRGGVQVPPLQKLLLGPHASLPRLARCEVGRDPAKTHHHERGIVPHGSKPKKRNHCVFTGAAGFLKYSG